MIYLQPHSGLANRIRVIISGLRFADIMQQKLILIWKKDHSLFCDYSDLFEVDDKIIVKKYNWKAKILHNFHKISIPDIVLYKLFSIDFCLFDKDFKEFVWSTGSNNIDLSKLPEKSTGFYFYTCHEFCFDRNYLNYLKPVKAIRENVSLIASLFTSKTIGIHIRRTDNHLSISESPLESFIEIIRNDLVLDIDTNYFLATDDLEVETMLKDLFPGKIITYEKDFSRTSVKGIQDAVVDLYSLAATSKIYGSYFSSFSDIAARIGNIPLKIIHKN